MKKEIKIGDYVADCTPELLDNVDRVIAIAPEGMLVVQDTESSELRLLHPDFAMAYDEASDIINSMVDCFDRPAQEPCPQDAAGDEEGEERIGDDPADFEDAQPLTERLYTFGNGDSVFVSVGDKIVSLDRYCEHYQQRGVVTALGLKSVSVLYDCGDAGVLDPRDLRFDKPRESPLFKDHFGLQWPGWSDVTYVSGSECADGLMKICVDPSTGVVRCLEL